MVYTNLPNTELDVSEICLGTMTWGNQNTEAQAHQQLNYATQRGVNFIDTAEIYAVPVSPETQGSTERFIGSWLSIPGNREKVILATKIAGPGRPFKHIREDLSFSKESIDHALHESLRRLQTDYVDLYQLHWPERGVNIFGTRDYHHSNKWSDNIAEVLDQLESYVKEGKIRHIGLSNETSWGLMRYMEEHRKGKLKMVSVQNAYSLLQRRDEAGVSEVVLREKMGYLAYSPLAFGMLSGKYLNNNWPKNARTTLFPNYNRYHNEGCFVATGAYEQIAKKYDLSLAQISLAFVRQQSFVSSTIIGATNMEQLKENIDSKDITLSQDIINDINAVHNNIPNPAP